MIKCKKIGKEPDLTFGETSQDKWEACEDPVKRAKILFMHRRMSRPEVDPYYGTWYPGGACIGRKLHDYMIDDYGYENCWAHEVSSLGLFFPYNSRRGLT